MAKRTEDLPYCASCLQDFDLYQYPCEFTCRHLYCTICLPKLRDGYGAYKCIYDGALSEETVTKSNLALFKLIDELKKGIETRQVTQDLQSQLEALKAAVNYLQVTCRNVIRQGICPHTETCLYDHSEKSVNISRHFCAQDSTFCWECRYCRLTISRKLPKCPACDCEQEDVLKATLSSNTRPSIRENKNGTNITLDQTVLTEEEKPRGLKPMLSDRTTPAIISEKEKREESARSACCVVQ